ncbi:hypothetical protein Tco_0671543 [Tanacetum coccineum]
MVAYLEKSEGSEGFHQIIDFLTASHIKNALTECPTLYASPIEQFWQTAALSTNEDGVRGITATIDRKVKVFVSEASIRRHLKLEDSEGLKTLPTVEIFEQLALMGYVTFTVYHSLERDEGSLSLHELIDLCTSLSKKVESLESELKQTKQTYNAALTKLIKRVKKLEQTIKTSQAKRKAKVVISDDEEAKEDPSNQGRSLIKELDLDARISLLQLLQTVCSFEEDKCLKMFIRTTKRRIEVSTDNGKAIMHESEPPKKIKKRVQVQMSVDEELAKKVFKEEQARFNAKQEARFKAKQEKKGLTLKQPWNCKSSWMKEKKLQPFLVAERIEKEVMNEYRDFDLTRSFQKTGEEEDSLARETLSEESAKKQKLEDDTEKEELQVYLNIVPEEESLNIESLATKYPIVDWGRTDSRNDKLLL